jgi:hypothetical protein
MAERLERLLCNQAEEMWISLRTGEGDPQVELRMYGRTAPAGAEPVRGAEAVAIPASLLPTLVRALSHVEKTLINRGVIYVPPSPKITHMEQGSNLTLGTEGRGGTQAARQHPRVALNVRVECRLLDAKDFWPSPPVNGEIKDVSLGGAQVCVAKRLPRFAQVEVFMVVDGLVFRGRAEVVAADIGHGRASDESGYRHSVRWLALESHAREVLTKIVASRTPPQVGPKQ